MLKMLPASVKLLHLIGTHKSLLPWIYANVENVACFRRLETVGCVICDFYRESPEAGVLPIWRCYSCGARQTGYSDANKKCSGACTIIMKSAWRWRTRLSFCVLPCMCML